MASAGSADDRVNALAQDHGRAVLPLALSATAEARATDAHRRRRSGYAQVSSDRCACADPPFASVSMEASQPCGAGAL